LICIKFSFKGAETPVWLALVDDDLLEARGKYTWNY